MYEVFEHTADLGLRVRAASLMELFAEAARGLVAMVVTNLDDVQPVQDMTFQITGSEAEYLLFDWLNELLYTIDTQRVVFNQFECRLSAGGLNCTARGEPIDEARHELDHEVKAITYHGLKVEEQPDGHWLAELIVDI